MERLVEDNVATRSISYRTRSSPRFGSFTLILQCLRAEGEIFAEAPGRLPCCTGGFARKSFGFYGIRFRLPHIYCLSESNFWRLASLTRIADIYSGST